MIESAENLAREHLITRGAVDACALRSHQRAAAAWSDGMRLPDEAFACQVLAVTGCWSGWDDPERLNVQASGLSLGHAVGATGSAC